MLKRVMNYQPMFLVCAGLGIPSAYRWVETIADGVAWAEDFIKDNPKYPVYVLKVEKHFQGTVNVHEVLYS